MSLPPIVHASDNFRKSIALLDNTPLAALRVTMRTPRGSRLVFTPTSYAQLAHYARRGWIFVRVEGGAS